VTRQGIFKVKNDLERLGVGVGDVVMIKAKNDCVGVTSLLGVWLQGCAACPVDPSAPAAVHDLVQEHSHASAVIDADGTLTPCGEKAEGSTIQKPNTRATGVDLALIIFTSGSSGKPKGVLLTHSNVMSSLRAISTYLEITEEDHIACVPPMFLDYGLYQVLFVLFTNCQLVLASDMRNPIKILSFIKEKQPTILPVIPALASGLATVLNTFNQTVESLRLVTNTGGHLAPSTIEAMNKSFPRADIFPMYGLTETKRALYLPPNFVKSKPGSVGGPMPGLDARVIIKTEDGDLIEALPNEIGELYLRGSSVMQGYHSNDNNAGARIIHGRYRDDIWLATGDLFERDEDGCLYFRGRTKSLIKQKGFCIYPRDVEAAVEQLPEVGSAAVVGRMESDGDESAILFVVLKDKATDEKKNELRTSILNVLHKSLQPREIHFLPEWPALPVGKIDFGRLEQMAKEK
jgi:acyl-CoA synthetase (AMP-forming)/AMP-acid ligase II